MGDCRSLSADHLSLQIKLGLQVVVQLVVNLDPAPLSVRDHQTVPCVVKLYSRRHSESPFRLKGINPATSLHYVNIGIYRLFVPLRKLLRVTDECRDEVAIGTVGLYAIVGPVANVNISIGIYSHIGGACQLATPIPFGSKGHQIFTIR